MALLCDATGERIDFGSHSSIDNLPDGANGFTVMYWMYATSDVDNSTHLSKGFPGGSANGWRVLNDGGGTVLLYIERATTDSHFQTSSSRSLNAWVYVAISYEQGIAGDDCVIYFGSLTSLATAQSLGTNTEGSGAIVTDASQNLIYGNLNFSSYGFPAMARMGPLHIVNTRLSRGEILKQQFQPQALSSTVLLADPHGTGTQQNRGGEPGVSGTVTSATVTPGCPVMVDNSEWYGDTGPVIAAAGGSIPIFYHHYKQMAGSC